MAKEVVGAKRLCVRAACQTFDISESCYRYVGKLDATNALIASWLMRLTDNNRSWGFGLCYLYLRNVKGFKWNHKRVYRIYKELELNLRIKPRLRRAYPLEPDFVKRMSNSVTGVVLALGSIPAVVAAMFVLHSPLFAALACIAFALGYVALYARLVRFHWCSPIAFLFVRPHRATALANAI